MRTIASLSDAVAARKPVPGNCSTTFCIEPSISQKLRMEAALTQTWDAQAYGQNGAFVHELAGGVLEWLDAQPGEHILDLGCGDGQLTQRIAATGAIMRGVDASPEMVASARSRGIMADEASAEAIPYASGSFDAVCSNAALHWMRDQDAVLGEVRRVLKPGGRFVAEMGGHTATSPPSAWP
ncbi:MAG TPA: class I SAM-dependent methyltransferase [Terracidiphilus sp.]|nr:class I SAM-dependent methyltransferase [Terracidiphilus sp.]